MKNKTIIKNLKRIDKLWELRVIQLKEVYQHKWYEMSLRDDQCKYFSKMYCQLKLMLNPGIKLNILETAKLEKEIRELGKTGMITIKDFKQLEPVDLTKD